MTIIQISKIQHRTGAQSDLPQLDKGEFGFATDSRRLFIGNDLSIYPQESQETSQTEVLTEYSTIRFSQVDGNGKDLLIDSGNIENGQIIRFDAQLDKWVLGGGSVEGNINLGDISNPKIFGGSGGMIVETDGLGNLSWGMKHYAFTQIENVSSASPALVTTTNPHPFLNSIPVTITDIIGLCTPASATGTISCSNSSSIVTGVGTSFSDSHIGKQIYTVSNALVGRISKIISTTSVQLTQTSLQTLSGASFKLGDSALNGNTFYVKVNTDNTFWLYADDALTSPVSTSSVTVNFISGGRAVGNVSPNTSGTGASGTNYSVQFAYNNVLSNNANLKYSSTGILYSPKFSGNGSLLTNINASSIVGVIPSAQSAQNANIANLASYVTQATQSNITTIGTLTNLGVTGNILVASANTTKVTGTFLSATTTPKYQILSTSYSGAGGLYGCFENSNKPPQQWFIKSRSGSLTSYSGTLSVGDYVGSLLWSAANSGSLVNQGELSLKIDTIASGVYRPKFSFKLLDSEKLAIDSNGNTTVTGNLTVTGNIVGSIQTARTVTACAQPNITSVGTLTALTVTGDSNLDDTIINGNLRVVGDAVSTVQVKTPLIRIGNTSTGTDGKLAIYSDDSSTPYWMDHNSASGNLRFSFGTSPNNDNFIRMNQTGDFQASGNIFADRFSGNGYSLHHINAANIVGDLPSSNTANTANIAKYVSQAAQSNITSVGVLTGLRVNGNITSGDRTTSHGRIATTIDGAEVVFGSQQRAAPANQKLWGIIHSSDGSVTFRNDDDSTGFKNILRFDKSAYSGTQTVLISPNGNLEATFSSSGLELVHNLDVGGRVTATRFVGDGGNLTNLDASSIAGTVSKANLATNANVAKYVSQSTQSNITQLGTLTSLRVSGDTSLGDQISTHGKLAFSNDGAYVLIGSEQRNAPANQQLWGIVHSSDGSISFRNDYGSNTKTSLRFNKSAFSGSQSIQLMPNGDSQVLIDSTGVDIADNLTVRNNSSISGNLTVTKNITANNISATFTGNLSGNASTATKLKTARKINGVNFDGTTDITIPSSYYIQSGFNYVTEWTTQVGNFGPSNKNYFDIFPPENYTMNNLAGFVAGLGEIYFGGSTVENDSLRCRPYYLSDRVRVYVNASEQRARPGANWMAIWNPFNSETGGDYYQTVINSPSNNAVTTTPTGINSNYMGGELSYSGVLNATSTVSFYANGSIGVSGVGRKYTDTLSSKSWYFPEASTVIGGAYWIKAVLVENNTVIGQNYQITGTFDQWLHLSSVKSWGLSLSDVEMNRLETCSIKMRLYISSDQKGVNILSDGTITLIVDI